MQVCKQTGKTPQELGITLPEMPEPPEDGLYLWNAFLSLSGARTSNGFGPNPITWADVDSFARLTGQSLTPWEAETLRSMDMAYLAAQPKPDTKS